MPNRFCDISFGFLVKGKVWLFFFPWQIEMGHYLRMVNGMGHKFAPAIQNL